MEIALSVEDGECGSGWTTATWGNCNVDLVDKFGGFTHKPVKPIEIEDIEPNVDAENMTTEIFSVSFDGGDGYYPMGGYNVNMELFKPNLRAGEFRPTYVFMGGSGVGKSTLASKFNEDVVVFETDAFAKLPDFIIADVVVLGNRYRHTIKDIAERVDDTTLIECLFNIYEN